MRISTPLKHSQNGLLPPSKWKKSLEPLLTLSKTNIAPEIQERSRKVFDAQNVYLRRSSIYRPSWKSRNLGGRTKGKRGTSCPGTSCKTKSPDIYLTFKCWDKPLGYQPSATWPKSDALQQVVVNISLNYYGSFWSIWSIPTVARLGLGFMFLTMRSPHFLNNLFCSKKIDGDFSPQPKNLQGFQSVSNFIIIPFLRWNHVHLDIEPSSHPTPHLRR